MSEMPWFQFYPNDWLSGTRGLSAVETGVYITIIATLYDRGEPLPNDTDRIARLCGASKRVFADALARLVADGKIEISPLGLTAPRLEVWRSWRGRRPIPTAIREAVFARDGHECVYCKTNDGPFHIDHVHPVALGGGNDLWNLVVACAGCNLAKGARSLDDWGLS